MISAESKDLLQDFEKRMRFVNLIKYWLQRSKPREINELLHNDDDKTDNLILMVMVFIMDSTLRYGERCTKQDITAFLRELADVYDYEPESAIILTDYIVTDVLQSNGKVRSFDTFYNSDEQFKDQRSLILLEQQSGSYVLTNEAYEFLFRTKEIDSELDFSVNRFKLQEFIKRGNYGKALRESRELVSRVRNLKTRMDDFMLRCRTNISEVSIDEYEEIVTQVRDSFEDENKQLSDIRTLVSAKLQAIADAQITTDENIGQTEQEIREILENIDTVISEQSRVFNQKFSLSELYANLLDDSFSYMQAGHFDLEQELLLPMQKMQLQDSKNLGKLFAPLYRPSFPHLFGPDFFYSRQNAIRESTRDDGVDIVSDDNAETAADIRNKRYVEIIKVLLSFANQNAIFSFSDYIASVSKEQLQEQLQEKSLPDVMLKLYGMGEIDVAGWRSEQHDIIVPVGEFDLSYCLSELTEDLVQMQSILIHKLDGVITLSDDAGNRIKINDFKIEVRR
ncbi:MAG: hypothetical protein IKH27_12335 [Oscillospiraceae bacterium]|nr:hypothetical protein [Oscillospiraceae bacterium]